MFDIFKKVPVNYENLSPSKFNLLMMDKGHIVLDVRTSEEVNDGAIPNAKHIDYFGGSFKSKVTELDKTKPYLIYCRNGGRARKSCTIMAKQGFKKLYVLKGGKKAWDKFKESNQSV